MKKLSKKVLSLALAVMMLLSMLPAVLAADNSGLNKITTGTYTYVSETPTAEAGSGEGQIQFIWDESKIVWAYGAADKVDTGSVTLTGDELEFFQGLYLSDRPTYDWLASAPRDTDGYAGNLSGNLQITITTEGKISKLRLDSGLVQMLAVVTKEITAPVLTISGATRGQPNLLHSCVTLVGSTNGLHLTEQGNVILDNLSIGSNENGLGLSADKIGGDTFIAGTVVVDGTIEWNCRYANIQPVHAEMPATLMTTGKDITMGGMNIGRVGRSLTISTGEDSGGNITIGAKVSVDYGRGGLLEDSSTGTLVLSTTGDIIAGLGDVTIGTNTERKVTIHTVGNIQGANVTIMPTHNGVASDIQDSIGNITATSGSITLVAGELGGGLGTLSAPKGTVKTDYSEPVPSNVPAIPTSSAIIVDGEKIEFDAYNIDGSNYFKLRDLAYTLSETEKQFEVSWLDGVANAYITLTSAKVYTPVGGEMQSKSSGTKNATESTWTIYLDGKQVSFTAYAIDGNNYFKLRDIAVAFDFGVDWDGAANMVTINTGKGYTS